MLVTKLVRTGAAALGIILATGLAQAADLYNGYGYKDQPAYILTPAWAGFYAGAHLGGAWSTIDAAENIVFLGATPGLIIADRTLNGSGFFGGVQAGYNFQSGNFVYGAEFDFGGMGSGANGSFRGPEGRVIRVDGSAGWYGDLTGRAGFSTGNALIYAKGGFAFFTGDVKFTSVYDHINQNSGTFTGWTIGGGLEYLISPSWSLKAEYMYFDFGNNTFSCCNGTASGHFEDSLTVNTVKVGFNYLVRSAFVPLN